MNKLQIFSFICLLLGISFFVLGFFYGDVDAGIFIIFPYISGTGIYSFISFLFIFISIIVFFFGFLSNFQQKNIETYNKISEPFKKTSIKGGGVVLIGPIPIVFGSNWKITVLLMILAILIILISFFYFY
jgi:uncharacterized protein (TIGR00304 family)